MVLSSWVVRKIPALFKNRLMYDGVSFPTPWGSNSSTHLLIHRKFSVFLSNSWFLILLSMALNLFFQSISYNFSKITVQPSTSPIKTKHNNQLSVPSVFPDLFQLLDPQPFLHDPLHHVIGLHVILVVVIHHHLLLPIPNHLLLGDLVNQVLEQTLRHLLLYHLFLLLLQALPLTRYLLLDLSLYLQPGVDLLQQVFALADLVGVDDLLSDVGGVAVAALHGSALQSQLLVHRVHLFLASCADQFLVVPLLIVALNLLFKNLHHPANNRLDVLQETRVEFVLRLPFRSDQVPILKLIDH